MAAKAKSEPAETAVMSALSETKAAHVKTEAAANNATEKAEAPVVKEEQDDDKENAETEPAEISKTTLAEAAEKLVVLSHQAEQEKTVADASLKTWGETAERFNENAKRWAQRAKDQAEKAKTVAEEALQPA